MAGDKVIRRDLAQFRALLRALLGRIRTARAETAAARRVDRSRHVARERWMRWLAAAISGSGIGTALINACVYGCNMLEYSSCTGARSTMQPRYITPTLWEM